MTEDLLVSKERSGAPPSTTITQPTINSETTSSNIETTEVLADANTESTRRQSNKRSSTTVSKNKASAKTHRVSAGESIASIAKAYDLDETNLRLRNRIPRDAEPLPGEKINLRKKISFLKRPKFTRVPQQDVLASADEYLF